MSLCGMGETMCIRGATDSEAFEVYVEHFLAPTLSEGQVVLDKLGAHRPQRIRELIERRGAELVYLPTYSPDLNPIEQAFSKIKTILRKLGARTHEALLEAMEEALREVTPGMRPDGSITAVTRSRFSTCECRCRSGTRR